MLFQGVSEEEVQLMHHQQGVQSRTKAAVPVEGGAVAAGDAQPRLRPGRYLQLAVNRPCRLGMIFSIMKIF